MKKLKISKTKRVKKNTKKRTRKIKLRSQKGGADITLNVYQQGNPDCLGQLTLRDGNNPRTMFDRLFNFNTSIGRADISPYSLIAVQTSERPWTLWLRSRDESWWFHSYTIERPSMIHLYEGCDEESNEAGASFNVDANNRLSLSEEEYQADDDDSENCSSDCGGEEEIGFHWIGEDAAGVLDDQLDGNFTITGDDNTNNIELFDIARTTPPGGPGNSPYNCLAWCVETTAANGNKVVIATNTHTDEERVFRAFRIYREEGGSIGIFYHDRGLTLASLPESYLEGNWTFRLDDDGDPYHHLAPEPPLAAVPQAQVAAPGPMFPGLQVGHLPGHLADHYLWVARWKGMRLFDHVPAVAAAAAAQQQQDNDDL